MKIARFTTGDEPRYGIVQGLPADEAAPTGESEGYLLVLKGDPLFSVPKATGEVVPLKEARLLSPVIPRSKVVGVGENYAAHARGCDGVGPGRAPHPLPQAQHLGHRPRRPDRPASLER